MHAAGKSCWFFSTGSMRLGSAALKTLRRVTRRVGLASNLAGKEIRHALRRSRHVARMSRDVAVMSR
jgi:hypothetical protein